MPRNFTCISHCFNHMCHYFLPLRIVKESMIMTKATPIVQPVRKISASAIIYTPITRQEGLEVMLPLTCP